MRWLGFRRSRIDDLRLAPFLKAGGWRVRAWGFFVGNGGLFWLWKDRDPETDKEGPVHE